MDKNKFWTHFRGNAKSAFSFHARNNFLSINFVKEKTRKKPTLLLETITQKLKKQTRISSILNLNSCYLHSGKNQICSPNANPSKFNFKRKSSYMTYVKCYCRIYRMFDCGKLWWLKFIKLSHTRTHFHRKLSIFIGTWLCVRTFFIAFLFIPRCIFFALF